MVASVDLHATSTGTDAMATLEIISHLDIISSILSNIVRALKLVTIG